LEDEIVEAFRKATKDLETQNTVVLSGLKLKETNSQDASGEMDFLIISLPLKSIIHIEAKKGNSNSNRRSASAQLKRGLTFFEKNFPFPASENWNYIKMMCFGESVEKNICDQCKPFVLSANFLEKKKTQPVAKQVADQFKTFWEGCKVHKGRPKFATEIFLLMANEFFQMSKKKKSLVGFNLEQFTVK
jgi:hypothetical protein